MYLANWNDDAMANTERRWFPVMFQREAMCHGRIVTVNPKEDADQDRCENQYNPGTITEFRNRKHAHHNPCADSAKSITEHLQEPAFFIAQIMCMLCCSIVLGVELSCAPPATRHPC